MDRKGDIFHMDPYFLVIFMGFGLIFGIAGTLIVYAAGYLPVDRRVAGIAVFLCGCAVSVYYRLQMPPTPFIPIPLLTTATGFLIHPLFIAAGVLVISGIDRYLTCLRKETVFSALFLTAGITAVLGGMGFYTTLSLATGGLHVIIPSLLKGIINTCIAAVLFMSACEIHTFLQERNERCVPER